MAGTSQFNEVLPVGFSFTFLPAYTPGTSEQLTRLGGQAGRVDVMLGINGDTVAHAVNVNLVNGTTTVTLGQVLVPAGAGEGTGAPYDILANLFPSTQQGITLAPGYDVYVVMPVAPGAGTFVSVAAVGGTL